MNRAESLILFLQDHAKHHPYNSARFFKTAPGDYAHHDQFLGVRMPFLRTVAQNNLAFDRSELTTLVHSPFHECRLLALLIATYQFERADAQEQHNMFTWYMEHAHQINNWDLVDVSAPSIVGGYLRNRSHELLFTLAESSNLWTRRIAIVSTLYFIRAHQLDTTFALAQRLINDSHDLMHKATGWMLREAGKKDEHRLIAFLNLHAADMPRTMLRYSIERLNGQLQQQFMRMGKPTR